MVGFWQPRLDTPHIHFILFLFHYMNLFIGHIHVKSFLYPFHIWAPWYICIQTYVQLKVVCGPGHEDHKIHLLLHLSVECVLYLHVWLWVRIGIRSRIMGLLIVLFKWSSAVQGLHENLVQNVTAVLKLEGMFWMNEWDFTKVPHMKSG